MKRKDQEILKEGVEGGEEKEEEKHCPRMKTKM